MWQTLETRCNRQDWREKLVLSSRMALCILTRRKINVIRFKSQIKKLKKLKEKRKTKGKERRNGTKKEDNSFFTTDLREKE